MSEAPLLDNTGSVTSPDGVKVTYWSAGAASGRPLVLIHGTTSDHNTFNELLPHASARRTTFVYDRRGRGESGEAETGSTYSIDLESADAAAVIDEVARQAGTSVDVLAHSFGGFVALGALALTTNVHSMVVYSPGFGAAYPDGALERVESAIADDDADHALQVIFHELIGMPMSEIAFMRTSPVWSVRTALAWSVVRECREDAVFVESHRDQLGAIALPLAILSGETNTEEKRQIADTLAGVIPGAELLELAGEGHAAHHTAPGALLDAALAFLDRD